MMSLDNKLATFNKMYLLCNNNFSNMEISVIKIGNSKGLRLSKSIIEEYNIKDKVELILEKEQIVLKPIAEPRKGWDKKFAEMHQNGDDFSLIDDVFEEDNFEEWT